MFNKIIVSFLTIYLASVAGTSNQNERPDWPGYQYYPQIEGWLKVHDPADWITARMKCHDEDATLAAPMNQKMYNVLKEVSKKDSSDPLDDDVVIASQPTPPYLGSMLYVGIQVSYPEGVYNIKNGKPVLSRDPYLTSNLNRCAVLYNESLTWMNCNDRLPYVCYAPAVISDCGLNNNGYSLDDRTGECYKFHWQAKPWDTAHRICLDEGAHLAIPNSDIEAQVLVDLFEEYPYEKLNGTNPAWGVMAIGFYYWKQVDKYVTIFGQTIEEAGYAKWSSGNPSSRGKSKELGGGMFRYGLLDDVDKSYAVPFICEKPSTKNIYR